jgi:hypothetical protein
VSMMKTILSMMIGISLFSQAQAATLMGTFIPGSVLGCYVNNTMSTKQRILQVEYTYYCQTSPTNPGGYQYQTTGCMGFCDLESGQTSYQNGPFAWCQPTFGNCRAWSQDITE